MTFFKKILGAAVVATLALSVVATSASAHNPQNYKGTGILPVLAGPLAAAAIAGPVTSTATWFTTQTQYFKFNWWNWKWQQVSYCHGHGCHKKYVKVKHSKSNKGINGKVAVGCIFGSALAVITASIRKASAMGNPPRWRSQAEHEKIVASGYEKQFELTNDEASTAAALCGLGSFALHWQQQKAPVVVKARY
jgi:hypothetical protein